MNDIVTIVTPSYNQGQFIEETINSVLSQEGDFFIQYIIADGGSTDNSVEIIKKYEKLLKEEKYPVRCKGIEYIWWSRKDRGQSHAINQGFKIAKGDILAWINSDDYYEPGAFDFVLKKFKENPEVDFIYGDVYIVDQNKKRKELSRSKQGGFDSFFAEKYTIHQPSTFYTKRIIEKVGLLDENLHYFMDRDLWFRILKITKSLYFQKPLSNFRIWENSKTSPYQEKRVLHEKKTLLNNFYLIDNDVKAYSYESMIEDLEYLIRKCKEMLQEYPYIHALYLRHLGTMKLLSGYRKESLTYFELSIKIYPSIRNILTFLSSLLGRRFYWYLLCLKRKIRNLLTKTWI